MRVVSARLLAHTLLHLPHPHARTNASPQVPATTSLATLRIGDCAAGAAAALAAGMAGSGELTCAALIAPLSCSLRNQASLATLLECVRSAMLSLK